MLAIIIIIIKELDFPIYRQGGCKEKKDYFQLPYKLHKASAKKIAMQRHL